MTSPKKPLRRYVLVERVDVRPGVRRLRLAPVCASVPRVPLLHRPAGPV